MRQTFYSNGKLLLIGEYTVLDGSDALALPTRYGQYIHIAPSTGRTITWKSYDHDNTVWFEALLSFDTIINNTTTGDKVTDTLIGILHTAHTMNPTVLEQHEGFTVNTELTFPRNWGLGSSSTLINNVAMWFGIDAFELLKKSFGGSGYDIACAQHDTPIVYSLKDGKPVITSIQFNPIFAANLYFIYLNKKQDTKAAVAGYKENAEEPQAIAQKVNTIIRQVLTTTSADDFSRLLDEHSALLSQTLQLETVKTSHFPDYPGTIKSLGAWGGDFVLAIAEDDPSPYFKSKGYYTIIPFNEMILK